MAIAEGIAAAKAALDVSKLALDLLRFPKLDAEQVRNKLIEMQDLVFSAQRALGDAEEENRNLKRQIDALKSEQEIEASLIFAQDTYWRRKPDGKLEGPFCPTCWDDTRKTMRLKRYGEGEFVGHKGRAVRYDCVLHKTEYFLPPGIFNPNSELIS
jgi:hypothetical protein